MNPEPLILGLKILRDPESDPSAAIERPYILTDDSGDDEIPETLRDVLTREDLPRDDGLGDIEFDDDF